MAVKGIFLSDSNIQGSRVGDFASGLLQTEQTGTAPLLGLSAGMNSADATDVVVTWFEENNLAGRVLVTDDNSSSDTTLTLNDAGEVTAGSIFMVELSGEYIYVEGVTGLVATVVRGFAGTTPAAINGAAAGAPGYVGIQRIGTAYEEGSGKPTSIANLGFPRFNYMQLFRNSWDVTGTAKAIQHHTGDVVAKNKRDAASLHAVDMERSMIFGRKAIGTQNGKPFRTMDGIIPQLSSNISPAGATTKWAAIDLFLEQVFARNIKGQPNERIAFCGNQALRVMNGIVKLDGTMQIEAGETSFGIKVMKWITPFGDISLMTHPMFSESPLWTKDMLVLHPGAMRTRYLRRTMEDNNDTDGSRAGVDADFGVLTTEMCMEYRAEATGGYMTGFTAAAAT